MKSFEDLAAIFANGRARTTSCNGYYAHIARYEHHGALLSGTGAYLTPGRFHVEGSAPALYFAESPVTALVEMEALLGSEGGLIMNKRPPMVIIRVQVTIPNGVLDITADDGLHSLLGTSFQELTGSWLYDDDPPTQRLGRAAYESQKVVAIRYPSGRWRGQTLHRNIVVFRDRLIAKRRGILLEPYDPQLVLPRTIQSIRSRDSRTRRTTS